MPIYEYRCNKCGYEFEARKPAAEDMEVGCPRCCDSYGEGQVTKLISLPARGIVK